MNQDPTLPDPAHDRRRTHARWYATAVIAVVTLVAIIQIMR